MSDIVKMAVAGTLESSDVYVEISPNDSGIQIELDSVVLDQFGESIRQSVAEVLEENEVRCARISLVDRGALDCVIRARVETAIMRAKGE